MSRSSTPSASTDTPLLVDLDFHKRQKALSIALLFPAAFAVLALILYPLLRVVEISFRDGKMMNFARISELPLGLGNYARVLADADFWNACATSALYVSGSVGVGFLIGLATALLLNEKLPGTRFMRTLVLLPWAVPGVTVAIMFLWLLDSSFGVFNAMLRDIGLLNGDFPWFVDSRSALVSVMLPTIWKTYPLITLTILAALQSVPRDLYEAAMIDGANRWNSFFDITWPGIKGPAYLVIMISALGVFRDIDIVFATTNGGPARATETLALYVYKEAFHYFRMGAATAVGTLMVGAAFFIAFLFAGLANRARY